MATRRSFHERPARRGANGREIVDVPAMRKHQLFTPLVEALERDSRASFNSRTSVFQTDDEGAIPSTRSYRLGTSGPAPAPGAGDLPQAVAVGDRRASHDWPRARGARSLPLPAPHSTNLAQTILGLLSSRISDEERGLQNRVRGFDSLPALYGKCREDYMNNLAHNRVPPKGYVFALSLPLRITTGWLP
jgi:hypothetical protein